MRLSGTLLVVLLILLALSVFSGCETTPGTSETDPPDPNDPPDSPTLVYPGDNATDQSISPTFIWECDDPDGDDLIFTHVIYEADDLLNTLQETVTDQYTLEWSGDNLAADTEYSWYVLADDEINDPVDCGLFTFTTGSGTNNPPSQPVGLIPEDDATDVDADDLTLFWDECMDPDGDPVVYDVYFNDGFGLDVVSEGQTGTSHNLGSLYNDMEYSWYIIARDDQGGMTPSLFHTFTTEAENNPPAVPSAPHPADDEPAAGLHTSLSWTCSDPDGDPLTYDVWFGPPLMELQIATGISETIVYVDGMRGNTEYSWSVTAHDGEGGETHGPFWTFTTANEIYAEIEVIRNISYYGTVTRSDMMKARFDAAYAPDGPIEPLQPYAVNGGPYSLEWLGTYEPFYFYRDPQNEPFLTLGSTYAFVVSPSGGISYLEVDVEMPDCEQYFTSPGMSTNVSLDGFTVEWYSSCPGTGTVDLYVRNGLGQNMHVSVPNSGSYSFDSGDLGRFSGSFELFVDIVTEEESTISEVGYFHRSFWRGKVTSTLMLYVM